ncbi:MAG: GvpL/GvpF family gas vesicle protein [Geobacteraceae bacterium]|nr:GvpL/GvpF family gas vesicle protein [Geobacteraceae bacterium]
MSKHLHCIISHDGGDVTLPADGAYLVPYRDVALVVRESPSIDYASLPQNILVRHLADHQALIEGIMKERTAIPIKFGTSVGDDGELLEMLESGYPSFKKAVDTMAGKVELDIIAMWNDIDAILRELGGREEIQRFKEDIFAASPEKLREQAVELGKMVRKALEEENCRVRDEIIISLRGHFLEQRIREQFDDRMLMNVAFLVERDVIKTLEERIDELDMSYGGRIDFRVIGPLPPHSFSTLEIRRIGAREMEEAMDLVGVEAGADKDEVRKAYRRLLRKYHPDKNPNDPEAPKRFEKFNRACETLADCNVLPEGNGAISIRVL